MNEAIIYLDPDSRLSLQAQIRQKLVEGIVLGAFPVGQRLPSSRKLAEQLNVARNTVVLVYQQLLDEGYLISRERSGIFVNAAVLEGRVSFDGKSRTQLYKSSHWQQRFKHTPMMDAEFLPPPNWQQYPYPFIDGYFDTALFPAREWREASRLALGMREINEWAGESGDADDAMLVEQIRTRILPRRGIQAGPDEILVTVGTQQALYILSELLVDSTVPVAVEEPGYPDLRRMLARRGAPLVHQPVDDEGMQVDTRLDGCGLVYVTPSHQAPTAVTMSMERRRALLEKANQQDFLVLEDDFEFESNFLQQPHPALRSIDSENRVVYVSCLSKVLSSGLRLGFIVAAAELISQARRLRRLMVRHPALNNQRAAAFFLSLGHYDSFMMHLHRIFRERWTELRLALNFYLVEHFETTRAQGGTSYWLRGPDDMDMDFLVEQAARRGILIEPVRHYYATENAPINCFRMGITGIPTEKIREGVAALADLLQQLTRGDADTWQQWSGYALEGEILRSALCESTLLCKTVYGDPCAIKLLADGSMHGRAGYANEDTDTGEWWVDGEFWHRRWRRWSYGEEAAYRTVIRGDAIKWFDRDYKLVESAVVRPAQGADAIKDDLD